MTTTTKKPTSKNLHYGGDSGFPPRRRRTIGDPRRNPRRRRPLGRNVVGSVADQRRRDMEARIRRQLEQRRPTEGRGGQQMTPAMRRRLMELRRRARQRRQLPPLQGRQPTATEVAQLKAARDRFNKQMQANVFGRGRKPTQATQTPKNALGYLSLDRFANSRDRFNKRKRPTAMPEPQLVPQRVAKGGVITKKNIGANDFRKGGYVLSTVDNRKNKK